MAQAGKKYKVLTVGPDIEGRGGISSVLKVYRRHIPGFSFLPTNSRRGHAAGYLKLLKALALIPFYRMKGYNIVHAHGGSGKSFVRKRIVLKWASAFGFKTVFHCHGGGFADYSRETGVENMRRMLSDYDALVCLSESWRKYFSTKLGCKDAVVIENIVERPGVIAEKAAFKAGETLKLLFLGKICREKGIFELVEALAVLRNRNIPVSLTVGGIGPEEESMRSAAEQAGISTAISYVGWVEGHKKDELMRTHHVMILPSYIEGMPISLLEAGAHGMPSVATDVGAVSEIVNNGISGTIIPVGDSDALAAAIEEYASDPRLLADRGREATLIASAHFPEKIASQLDRLYDNLITKR